MFDIINNIESKIKVFCLMFVLLSLVLEGCAVRYYDKTSGSEHIIGFSHVKTKPVIENGNVRATISQTQVVGLAIDAGQENYGISAGWDRSRQIRVADNTTMSLDWPKTSFFDIRIGTNLPPYAVNQQNAP